MLKKIKEKVQLFLAIKIVRHVIVNFNYYILLVLSKSRFLSAIYSSFITFAFLREQHAVIAGKLEYYKKIKRKNLVNWTIIRRNTHRLEKALTMRNRKKIFALDYIEETIEEYEKIAEQSTISDSADAYKWTTDVLQEYFKAVEKNSFLEKLYVRFVRASSKSVLPQCESEEKFAPYLRSFNTKITYEDLLSLSYQRRAVRFYEDKRVPRDLIDQALTIGKLAPSACNRQPYKYLIFNGENAKEIGSVPFGATGYSDNIQCIAVVIGDLSQYSNARDRHIIYIDAALSAMSFMYALEVLGLSSCPINWPDFGPLEQKMRKKLKLKFYERPIMLISIGYPRKDIEVAYSCKKSLDEIRSYDLEK
jgi:nitroreductase